MSTEQWIALLAVCVAVVALAATVVLGLALRRTRADVRALGRTKNAAAEPVQRDLDLARSSDQPAQAIEVIPAHVPLPESMPGRGEPQVVTREGRVVALPSREQVVEATMGKPMIRGAVLAHGVRYALRPQSRDRLRGMVRREYRRRRRVRLRAGRRATRAADIPPAPQSWLGTAQTHRLNAEDDGGS